MAGFDVHSKPDKEWPDSRYELKICNDCHELYDGSRNAAKARRCSCRGRNDNAVKDEYFAKYGVHLDVAATWVLCDFCAQDVTTGLTRWSLLVCPTCRRAVDRLHEAVGARVIPIGRHSLMNGVALAGDHVANTAAVREFTNAFKKLTGRWGILNTWSEIVLRENLEAVATPGGRDLTLRQIRWRLGRLAKTDPKYGQEAALDRFLGWLGIDPVALAKQGRGAVFSSFGTDPG